MWLCVCVYTCIYMKIYSTNYRPGQEAKHWQHLRSTLPPYMSSLIKFPFLPPVLFTSHHVKKIFFPPFAHASGVSPAFLLCPCLSLSKVLSDTSFTGEKWNKVVQQSRDVHTCICTFHLCREQETRCFNENVLTEKNRGDKWPDGRGVWEPLDHLLLPKTSWNWVCSLQQWGGPRSN